LTPFLSESYHLYKTKNRKRKRQKNEKNSSFFVLENSYIQTKKTFIISMPKNKKEEKMAKTPMTSKAASRIQSATAKANGGSVLKGSFASRAQRAAAKNSSKK